MNFEFVQNYEHVKLIWKICPVFDKKSNIQYT